MATINAGMSLNFNQIGLLIVELAALERLEKSLTMGETLFSENIVTFHIIIIKISSG